ncbi:MAG: T9SS type A sorting domain-containing protein [Chlorobi bacterium]|nr:T9SS type A sorting domain-containing protein [Chlorobiota bacterium]
MTANDQFPILEFDTLCHFVFQGNAQSVSVPGDATGWNPSGANMANMEGTDFWFLSRTYEADARLDYKFVINNTNWITDPLNPNTVMGGFGPNSELAMPAYIQPPEIEFYPNIPHGTIFDTVFYSAFLGNSRTIKVYLPPDYNSTTNNYPLVLFHDGLEYLELASANNVFDYLINENLMESVIGIFVPPVNREPEYAGILQDEFTSFIIEELMPWIDGRFRTKTQAHFRATAGASNGGNIALWLGLHHPETFGKVAAYSSNVQTSISLGLQNGPLLDLKFYLDIGTYDISVLIPLVHNLRDILEDKGYEYEFKEWHEGHSWGNWRAHIDNAMQFFFANPSSVNENRTNNDLILYQNYPNPCKNFTKISFESTPENEVEVSLYDIQGKKLKEIWKGKTTTSLKEINFDTWMLENGVYFIRLVSGKQSVVRKMVIN